jgi:hypothetical protein
VGFGLTSALIPPFAMFGVKSDGQLYARSVAPGQLLETPIPGPWFAAPHRFRIDWNASTVVYWIDGTQRVTHSITYKGQSGSLRPAITDAAVGGDTLSVDWMRMTPYAAAGSYTSPVYDAGQEVAWQSGAWIGDSPVNTSIRLEVRTGNTATPDETWTAFRAIDAGTTIGGDAARYAQYRVVLSTTAANVAPALKEVVLTFQR